MSRYGSASDAIDYAEQTYVYCREPDCDWHRTCSWEELEDVKKQGHVHWQQVHGRTP